MSTSGLATQERLALADLLAHLGPDAPTLCIGWQTRELAAHLVARESRPDAVPGLLVPLFSSWTERLERQVRDANDYETLVGRIRKGPPLLGPFGMPFLRETANIHEFYVHHEDVRRPNGYGSRRLSAEMEEALWRRLRLISAFMTRRVDGLGVDLVRTGRGGRQSHRARSGTPVVTLEGRAGELFLYLFNRREHADVTVSGPDDAVQRLARTRLGL